MQEDLHGIGTATHIHKMFKLPGRQPEADRPGAPRLRLDEGRVDTPTCAPASRRPQKAPTIPIVSEIDALARNIKANFQQVVSLSPLLSDDLQTRWRPTSHRAWPRWPTLSLPASPRSVPR